MSVLPLCTAKVLAVSGFPAPPPVMQCCALCRRASSEQLPSILSGPFRPRPPNSCGGAASPACPWCGEDETRPHRFLHCSAFQALRSKHSQAVHILRTHRPEWVYAPFPTVPDEVDILTLIFQSRPPPSWPHASWAGGSQSVQSLRFFTDGTCAHPTEPLASHAAWALVWDCTPTDQDFADARQFWLQTGSHPPHLRVVDRGLVPAHKVFSALSFALHCRRSGMGGWQVRCLPRWSRTRPKWFEPLSWQPVVPLKPLFPKRPIVISSCFCRMRGSR